MARKSVNFNVSEETYNRIHEIFPGVLGTDENLQLLIQAYDYWCENKDGAETGGKECFYGERVGRTTAEGSKPVRKRYGEFEGDQLS